MTSKLTENYLSKLLPLLLTTYQFIEEGLKTCIRYHHVYIFQKLDNAFPYNPPIASIDKAPLGKLVQMYKTFTNDKEFIKKLDQLPKTRNIWAHQGYILYDRDLKNAEAMKTKTIQLKEDLEKAQVLLKKIQEEAFKLEELIKKKN